MILILSGIVQRRGGLAQKKTSIQDKPLLHRIVWRKVYVYMQIGSFKVVAPIGVSDT